MSKDLVTMTIEIDREVYNKAAELIQEPRDNELKI